ncbi:MAG: S8 family serine peptidase [Thermoanaerobaculia bacterium]
MSHRRAGRFLIEEKLASRAAMAYSVDRVLGLSTANVLFDNVPADDLARRTLVFEAEPAELAGIAAAAAGAGSDVIIEPELLRWPSVVFPAPFRQFQGPGLAAAAPAGTGRKFEVRALSAGAPLALATVYLFLQGSGGNRTTLTAETGADGKVTFEHSAYWLPAAALVIPYANAWGTVARGAKSPMLVECEPLPTEPYRPWWHEVLRVDTAVASRGAAIRVGVCDTGCGPHAGLIHHVDAGAFIGGGHYPGAGADVDSHGTHVSGIIGNRAANAWDQGMSPGSELFMARVFPPDNGASQADVSNAIDALSKLHQCDLINLSLGSTSPSEIERDALLDAFERGTLAICAAGNEGGPVSYPASYDVTVAVSALGSSGWGPAESDANLDIPQLADRFGDENLYLAGFSCFGPEIDVAGPGVGVISTVPERHGLVAPRAEMSGTSMASPAVCGALAVLLARDALYKALPRDSSRSTQARSILRKACREIGLEAMFEGYGVPKAG